MRQLGGTVRRVDPSRRHSLLAELALRFGRDRRELWATEALGHLLASGVCQETLRRMLNERGAQLPERLEYRTEVVDRAAEGRPDVVGAIGDSRYVILEGKFWASLTDSQPVGYLKSLGEGGCLVVVAPHLRFETIGKELERRCTDAGLSLGEAQSATEAALLRVDGRYLMGLVSWRDLLGNFRAALQHAGDTRLASDVDQLDSLCDLEDSDAFLPMTSSDLSNPTPLRVYQYMELVEEVARRGSRKGRLSTQGLRSSGPMGRYIRYAAADDLQLALSLDLQRWSRQRHTPLWLEIAVEPGDALRGLEAERPSRVFYDGYKNRPVIPLTLPLHVEKPSVIAELLRQVLEIVDLVRDCPRTVTIGTPGTAESTPADETTGGEPLERSTGGPNCGRSGSGNRAAPRRRMTVAR